MLHGKEQGQADAARELDASPKERRLVAELPERLVAELPLRPLSEDCDLQAPSIDAPLRGRGAWGEGATRRGRSRTPKSRCRRCRGR